MASTMTRGSFSVDRLTPAGVRGSGVAALPGLPPRPGMASALRACGIGCCDVAGASAPAWPWPRPSGRVGASDVVRAGRWTCGVVRWQAAVGPAIFRPHALDRVCRRPYILPSSRWRQSSPRSAPRVERTGGSGRARLRPFVRAPGRWGVPRHLGRRPRRHACRPSDEPSYPVV